MVTSSRQIFESCQFAHECRLCFSAGQVKHHLSVKDSDGDVADIGAWDYVQNERTCPIENMEVWDGTSGARISFNVAETTRSQFEGMARLTENLNLQRGLLRLLDNVPAVDLIHQTRVTSIDSESQGFGNWPIVNLNNGRRLRARLLVNIQIALKLKTNVRYYRSEQMDPILQSEITLRYPPSAGPTMLEG